MTDQELDSLIDTAKPTIRTMLRAVIEQGQHGGMFNIAAIPLPNGQVWDVVCGVFSEPASKLLAAMLAQGVPHMMESFAKLALKPGQPQLGATQTPKTGGPGGFTVPKRA